MNRIILIALLLLLVVLPTSGHNRSRYADPGTVRGDLSVLGGIIVDSLTVRSSGSTDFNAVNLTDTGTILPAGDRTHDIGSPTRQFSIVHVDTVLLSDGGVIRVSPGFRITFNESSNIFEFVGGVLTLAGTSRVIKHLHFTMELGKGQNAPSERFDEDPYISYTYGINDDSHLSREAPDDMDYTADSVIKVHWYTTDATAGGTDEVRWAVQWASRAVSEDITAGDTLDNSGDIVCSAANIIVETSVETIPANSIAASDMIGIHIQRVALGDGTNPQASTIHIVDVELQYVSNKLGE